MLAKADDQNPDKGVALSTVAAGMDGVAHTLRAHGYDGPAPTLVLIQSCG